MAGPSALVLFPNRVEPEQIRQVIKTAHVVHEVPHPNCDNLILYATVDLCLVSVNRWVEEFPGELHEMESGGLAAALGWAVRDGVDISAECNSDMDHVVLGKLCHLLAHRFGGVIAHPIATYVLAADRAEDLRPTRSVRKQVFTALADLPGKLYSVPYLDDDGGVIEDEEFFFCDAEFMAAWLRHPLFRMSK
jgi:hypothetical protein